ncbi:MULTISPECIES: DUF7475 family protein [Halococcus]|uniref:Uncharacterized protein n=1 Tax=Halococcus dombrowskii TaxID=179637 RepID=A0AAV3SGR4_HALDO|nr:MULTISPECIES: hypothetical protein [Halococcus]UOO97521.1 hypothetical protein MUK72_18840 [Halococcus dombrowskii]
MASQSTGTASSQSLVSLPTNSIAYVALLGALVSAVIHLYLAPSILAFSQTSGILFYLNGVGWLAGILVFVSRFWRREFYLVAAAYAIITVIAFFVMSGDLSGLALPSKAAEIVVAAVSLYLYPS